MSTATSTFDQPRGGQPSHQNPALNEQAFARGSAQAAAAEGRGMTAGGTYARTGLLVNTTSLGMKGHEALELRLDDLPKTALVNDIVYVPLETPLLAAARRRGNPVVDGLGMLLHQARPGFRAWFGVDPLVTPALRDAVLATL